MIMENFHCDVEIIETPNVGIEKFATLTRCVVGPPALNVNPIALAVYC